MAQFRYLRRILSSASEDHIYQTRSCMTSPLQHIHHILLLAAYHLITIPKHAKSNLLQLVMQTSATQYDSKLFSRAKDRFFQSTFGLTEHCPVIPVQQSIYSARRCSLVDFIQIVDGLFDLVLCPFQPKIGMDFCCNQIS